MDKTYIPAFTLEPLKKAPKANSSKGVGVHSFIEDLAAGRVELPTIPRIVQHLITVMRSPDVDTRDLGEMLSRDAGLSAKVLRLANSSLFGGHRSMASIDAAVTMIGTQALHRIVIASGVSSSFRDVPGIDMKVFWRDSLLAATAASKLAVTLEANPEEAYVCGLLHATGHLILCQSYPDVANAMFTGFAVVRGSELAAIELEAFGISHPAVGSLWAESLGFPKIIVSTIGNTTRSLDYVHGPLDLVQRGACSLAAAVAERELVEVALVALPPSLRAPFSTPGGEPSCAFMTLYDELQEVDLF